MVTTTSDEQRSQSSRTGSRVELAYVLRVSSTLLLVLFYALVGLQWSGEVMTHARELWHGGDRAYHALVGINSVFTALFFLVVAVLMLFRKEPIRREHRIVGWVLPTIAVVAPGLAVNGDPVRHALPVMLLATVLVLSGAVLTLYGLGHLRRHFGVVPDVRGMVTSGPYRFVRHPLYAGETLALGGVVIVVLSPFAVAAFTVGIIAQVWRARYEERNLATVFPEYREYARRTPMLIPFLRLPTPQA